MAPKPLVTSDAYERLCLAGEIGPSELVDGEIIMMAPGGFEHSFTSNRVGMMLSNFVVGRKLGRVLANEAGIHLDKEKGRSCGADVVFISYKRIPREERPRGFLTIPPELIVEVLPDDGSWTDMEKKVDEYHAFGVEMVWVADPNTRTVKLYPRGGEARIVHDGSELDGAPVLPGFKVPVAKFFDED